MVDATMRWYKSSFCESSACLEVARFGDDVAVRNNTQPQEHLIVSRTAWNDLVDRISSGQYRDL